MCQEEKNFICSGVISLVICAMLFITIVNPFNLTDELQTYFIGATAALIPIGFLVYYYCQDFSKKNPIFVTVHAIIMGLGVALIGFSLDTFFPLDKPLELKDAKIVSNDYIEDKEELANRLSRFIISLYSVGTKEENEIYTKNARELGNTGREREFIVNSYLFKIIADPTGAENSVLKLLKPSAIKEIKKYSDSIKQGEQGKLRIEVSIKDIYLVDPYKASAGSYCYYQNTYAVVAELKHVTDNKTTIETKKILVEYGSLTNSFEIKGNMEHTPIEEKIANILVPSAANYKDEENKTAPWQKCLKQGLEEFTNEGYSYSAMPYDVINANGIVYLPFEINTSILNKAGVRGYVTYKETTVNNNNDVFCGAAKIL